MMSLIQAAQNGHDAIVQTLLAQGADVNAKDDKDGSTALIWAAKYGHDNVVQTLLAQGVDVNAKKDDGWTALMMAVQYGYEDVVQTLLSEDAEVNAKTNNGETALMMAAQIGHDDVVRTLLAHGAEVNVKTNDENESTLYTEGMTALMGAARNGHDDVVQTLLAQGADVNAEDNSGRTALSVASKQGHDDIEREKANKFAELFHSLNDSIAESYVKKITETIDNLIDTLKDLSNHIDQNKFKKLFELYIKSMSIDVPSHGFDNYKNEEMVFSTFRKLRELAPESIRPLITAWKEADQKRMYSLLIEMSLASIGADVVEPLSIEIKRKCKQFKDLPVHNNRDTDIQIQTEYEAFRNSFVRIMEFIGPTAINPLNITMEEDRHLNEAMEISLEKLTGENISITGEDISKGEDEWEWWWDISVLFVAIIILLLLFSFT